MANPTHRPGPVKLLVFGASLRRDSLNAKLAALAARVAADQGAAVDLAAMSDFTTPAYDGDAETERGIPDGAGALRARLLAADAFVIAAPEYNASLPGALKNTIDWVSRFRPQPFNERHGLLMSASPSLAGGNRGLWALRIPFEHLGARIYPDMFSLAQAHQAFAGERLANAALEERFEKNLQGFLALVEAAKHYPCAKRAWIEFLGEPPAAGADRVDPPAAPASST
jgi:chromate reductase, NAD(P)H dehydrogenase (quinone)